MGQLPTSRFDLLSDRLVNLPNHPLRGLLANLSTWTRPQRAHGVTAPPVINVLPQNSHTTSSRSAQPQSFWQCLDPEKASVQPPVTTRNLFQVRVRGQVVAEVRGRRAAEKLAQQFMTVLHDPGFDPWTLTPALVDGQPAGKAGKQVLFRVHRNLEKAFHRSGDLIAIDWVNNLRSAMGVAPLSLIEAQTQMYALTPGDRTLWGTASWYGPYFHNRLTATGERFDQNDLTAAHPTLPFGTYLKVTNMESRNSVIVRVNDRGPYVGDRSLDLSRQAARCIGSEHPGVVPYTAEVMLPAPSESKTFQITQQPPTSSLQVAGEDLGNFRWEQN